MAVADTPKVDSAAKRMSFTVFMAMARLWRIAALLLGLVLVVATLFGNTLGRRRTPHGAAGVKGPRGTSTAGVVTRARDRWRVGDVSSEYVVVMATSRGCAVGAAEQRHSGPYAGRASWASEILIRRLPLSHSGSGLRLSSQAVRLSSEPQFG